MHEFIKKIFGRHSQAARTISLDAVPAWTDEREKKARAILHAETEEPIRTIRNTAAGLQLIVNGIAGAEHDPALHPKLKSIAKNSLPLFVKAMHATLAKELPEDPEEFYTAAVECLKGCLNSSRGQGRYLQAVFPEEMKDVRTGIDAMGREINTLTGHLAKYRREMQDIAAVRLTYATVRDLKTDFTTSAEKDRRISQRISEIAHRLEAIETEETALAGDDRQAVVAAKKQELSAIVRARDEVARSYSAHSMTASHVFRKAEKIAARQHHTTETALLDRAMDLLSSHEIPDGSQLSEVLSAACPIAERMIASGDIILKNKEERTIFSDIPRFCSTIRETCLELATREEEVRHTGNALATDPLLMKIGSLAREKAHLNTMLEKERLAKQDIEDWRAKTREKIPALTEELRKKMESMEENVQIQINDQMPS